MTAPPHPDLAAWLQQGDSKRRHEAVTSCPGLIPALLRNPDLAARIDAGKSPYPWLEERLTGRHPGFSTRTYAYVSKLPAALLRETDRRPDGLPTLPLLLALECIAPDHRPKDLETWRHFLEVFDLARYLAPRTAPTADPASRPDPHARFCALMKEFGTLTHGNWGRPDAEAKRGDPSNRPMTPPVLENVRIGWRNILLPLATATTALDDRLKPTARENPLHVRRIGYRVARDIAAPLKLTQWNEISQRNASTGNADVLRNPRWLRFHEMPLDSHRQHLPSLFKPQVIKGADGTPIAVIPIARMDVAARLGTAMSNCFTKWSERFLNPCRGTFPHQHVLFMINLDAMQKSTKEPVTARRLPDLLAEALERGALHTGNEAASLAHITFVPKDTDNPRTYIPRVNEHKYAGNLEVTETSDDALTVIRVGPHAIALRALLQPMSHARGDLLRWSARRTARWHGVDSLPPLRGLDAMVGFSIDNQTQYDHFLQAVGFSLHHDIHRNMPKLSSESIITNLKLRPLINTHLSREPSDPAR